VGSGFDAAAATAAYLRTLSPEAHARAIAYTHGSHWLLLWGLLATIVSALIILKSGVLRRVEGRLEAKQPRPKTVAFVCAVIFFAIDFAIEMPWNSYAQWWRERSYGLTSQSWSGWAGEQLAGAAISLVLTGVFAMILYLLIRRAPRAWWAWAGGLVALFLAFTIILSPIFIEPLFNKFTPAPPGQLRDQVVQLAKASGVPSDKIYVYNGSKQSNRYTANVSGLFGTARVAMSDTMFQRGADLGEVRAVVGHEMGHYARYHVLWGVLAMSLLAVLFFWLIDRLFPRMQRLLGEDRLKGIVDPAGLPIVVILAAVLAFIATPLLSSLTRFGEMDADRFSLEHAREPDGLARALVKTIEYRAASPSRLEEILFYDHPSVERRIRRAMDWKQAHLNEASQART